MHLQDPNWCRLDRFHGLPRLHCVVICSFLFVLASGTMDGTTGRKLSPSRPPIHIRIWFREECIQYVRCAVVMKRFQGVVTFPGGRRWITNPANQPFLILWIRKIMLQYNINHCFVGVFHRHVQTAWRSINVSTKSHTDCGCTPETSRSSCVSKDGSVEKAYPKSNVLGDAPRDCLTEVFKTRSVIQRSWAVF